MTTLYSPEAEMSALGSCFLSRKALAEAQQIGLRIEHFFSPGNRRIYRSLCLLYAEGHEADIVSVKNHLGGELADVGGLDYLMQVMEYVPSPANIAAYAKRVVNLWKLRSIVALGQEIEEDPEMDAAEIEAKMEGIQELSRLVIPAFDPIQLGTISTAQVPGVTSGFKWLDRLTIMRGWPSGQTSIVSAYHKGGKTSLLLQSSYAAAKSGAHVLYASFADLDDHGIQSRLLKQQTGYSYQPSRMDALADWDECLKSFQALPYHVYTPAKARTPRDIESFAPWLERQMARTEYSIVFMDYAQRVRSRDRKAISEYAEAAIVADRIQELAQAIGIPIILGAQITPGGKDGVDKTKGSRVWEENAGLVVRIKPHEDNKQLRVVEVPFNRFGPAGDALVQWDSERVRFGEEV